MAAARPALGQRVVVAGGGIGGLGAALACARAGFGVRLFERADRFSEAGAGLQLGPNVTRRLQAWGLDGPLRELAFFPARLRVRSARSGHELAQLALDRHFRDRYGAPYATMHRGDLQGLLLDAVRGEGIPLATASLVGAVALSDGAVRLSAGERNEIECDALVGADGLWSAVRRYVAGDSPPVRTGHVAYRALMPQSSLPPALRQDDVQAWLGPHMHLVAYPVRAGHLLNIVAVVQGSPREDEHDWDLSGSASDLHAALGTLCKPLKDLVATVEAWRMWTLHDRAPVTGPHEMATGRIALVGDAAHPMRPYLAQGAAMAIEDAAELGRCLATVTEGSVDVPGALQRYAHDRWQRCAQVQRQSRRNGTIFHATGIVRFGRDAALRVLGERLLDQPWLYGG